MTRVLVDIGGDELVMVMLTDEALKQLDARVGDYLEVINDFRVLTARELH